MKIGILDIDCHGAKKKWGATDFKDFSPRKGFVCGKYFDKQ